MKIHLKIRFQKYRQYAKMTFRIGGGVVPQTLFFPSLIPDLLPRGAQTPKIPHFSCQNVFETHVRTSLQQSPLLPYSKKSHSFLLFFYSFCQDFGRQCTGMLQEYCSNTAVFLQYSCSNSNTGGILRYAAGMLQECYRNTA